MRTLIIISVLLVVLIAIGVVAYQPAVAQWQKLNTPNWRTEDVVEGNIVSSVNTTGTIKPVLSVAVGAFVSGPIREVKVEFNQEVEERQVLAEIDSTIYDANVARDEASLANRKADVERVTALLNQAIRDENRSILLREEDSSFISQSEMDKYRFNRESLAAQLKFSKTAVDQAQAALNYSLAQQDYTVIRSPKKGIVINRKIDPGQTLAAQFQTPELFVVAPDMREKMHVHASVDEADIGLVDEAKKQGQPVWFTVDAYPDELFKGAIEEIRLSSTTTQNVVTYPVVCGAPNPDLKLLPGMTASLSFQVAERKGIIKIPNSALRFYPLLKYVRKEDRPLLEGQEKTTEEKQNEQAEKSLSAQERSELRRKRNRRHVWVQEGHLLRAVEVVTGLSDNHYTELESGDLKDGDVLVTGIKPKVYGAQ